MCLAGGDKVGICLQVARTESHKIGWHHQGHEYRKGKSSEDCALGEDGAKFRAQEAEEVPAEKRSLQKNCKGILPQESNAAFQEQGGISRVPTAGRSSKVRTEN